METERPGTSPQSRTFNHGQDLDDIVTRARNLLEDLRRNHPYLILRFSGEDAFRTRLDDLCRVYDPLAPLAYSPLSSTRAYASFGS